MSEEERVGFREHLIEFIETYHRETCLWNTKSKAYHDRDKKNAAYNRLVQKYKAIDPNATRETVVKKINNLRTAYKKELNKMIKSHKSGAEGDEIYIPRLWYFDLLSFLYDQELPRPSIWKTEEDENEKQSTTSIGPSDPLNPSDSDGDTTTLSDNDRNTLKSEQDSPITKRSRPKPRKNTLAEDVLKSVHEHFKRPKIPGNRFEVYGKNIGMKLQELPNEQRIFAEKIINETLFLAEMGSLTILHTVTAKPN